MANDSAGSGLQVGQTIELTIERLSYNGGRGVGRFNDFVFFVSRTAPNEVVRARISELKKNYGVAELIEIVTPAPARRTAPCPVADRCGGCPWQHIEYSEQLQQKQQIFLRSLQKLLSQSRAEVLPILASPEEFNYRNRIQVHRQGSEVGFLAKGTRELVPTDSCLIAERPVSEKITEILQQTEALPELQRFEIARTRAGVVAVEKNSLDPKQALFTQVNTAQNEVLCDLVVDWARPEEPGPLVDLYSGAGNFTLRLAEKYHDRKIFGVELSSKAVAIARELEREKFGAERILWHAGPAAEIARLETEGSPAALILDPPRPGCDAKTIEAVNGSRSRKVVYVSCNPMTFARDAEKLTNQGPYRLARLQPLDMFPQTEHIELVALFLLRGN